MYPGWKTESFSVTLMKSKSQNSVYDLKTALTILPLLKGYLPILSDHKKNLTVHKNGLITNVSIFSGHEREVIVQMSGRKEEVLQW